ncbi:SDR family oxidoreductase [Streptomyces sp. NBC_00076]|uniref:SDR family oxidoreductase n=1 Tax=Streptomyces sp. NBC_00076 TaxID=2975642 RepID=UPI003246B8F1
MKVALIDDGGPMGVETAAGVRAHGHEAVVVSAAAGVDVLTGEGLSRVLEGCSVVIDLSGPPSIADGTLTEAFGLVIDDETVTQRLCLSTANLLAAEADAGLGHHVALSVVGVERLKDRGYFRALHAQETMIRQSRTPYSIIRSTQLFESADDIADSAAEHGITWLAPAQIRPVSCAEAAVLVAHTAVFNPLLGVREIAGPDRLPLDTFVRAALTAAGEHRRVLTDDRSLYFGAGLRRGDLLPRADAYIARTHYHDWLDGRG